MAQEFLKRKTKRTAHSLVSSIYKTFEIELELELNRRLRPSWAMFVARWAASNMVLACARGGTKSLVVAEWVIERGEGLPVTIQPVFKVIARWGVDDTLGQTIPGCCYPVGE
jgi:hypothetical protein